jgi:hypothetical protein
VGVRIAINVPPTNTTSLADIFGTTPATEIKMAIQFGNPNPQQPQPDLAAEEARLRAQAAQQQVMPGFAEAITRIQMSGRGFPPLGGAAAQMYAAMGGQAIAPGVTFPGIGELARMPVAITEAIHVLQLANELMPQQQQAPAAAPPPPAAPAPAPTPRVGHAVGHRRDAAAGTVVAAGCAARAAARRTAVAAASRGKARRGFPDDADDGRRTDAPASFMFPPSQQPQGSAAPVPPSPATPVATASPAAPATSPARRVEETRPEAEGDHAGTRSGVPGAERIGAGDSDARCRLCGVRRLRAERRTHAPRAVHRQHRQRARVALLPAAVPARSCAARRRMARSGLARWKGAIRAIVLEQPPPAGTYYMRARGNEIAEEVAAALQTLCDKTGGLYARAA